MICQIANCREEASHILYNKVYKSEIRVCERCAEEMLSLDWKTYEFVNTFGEKDYSKGEGKLIVLTFAIIMFFIVFAIVSGLLCGEYRGIL